MQYKDTIYRRSLFVAALRTAIPLWRERIKGYDDATCEARAHAAGELIACYGDLLMFGRRSGRGDFHGRNLIDIWVRRGCDRYGYRDNPFNPAPSSGEVFNALAEGAAIFCRMTGRDPGSFIDTFFTAGDFFTDNGAKIGVHKG